MTTYKISVRSLVEFLLRSGDIDSTHRAPSEAAMLEGGRIHRRIQKMRGPSYTAEALLSLSYDTGRYKVLVSGRADGILEPEDEKSYERAGMRFKDGDFSQLSLYDMSSEDKTLKIMKPDSKIFESRVYENKISESKTGENKIPESMIYENQTPENQITENIIYGRKPLKDTISGINAADLIGKVNRKESDILLLPVVEEIKTTYADVSKMDASKPVHLAQAKCYAFFYCALNAVRRIRVLMTYVNIDTNEIKYFDYLYTAEELSEWFNALMLKYKLWSDYSYDWSNTKSAAIKQTVFPYPYRAGQKKIDGTGVQHHHPRKKAFP